MRYILTLFIVLFATSVFAGPYATLYPEDEQSNLWGPIEVLVCTDGDVLGTDCGTDGKSAYGFMIEIASGTVTLPNALQGMWGCVKGTTTAQIHIDVQGGDYWVLGGVILTVGNKISSDSGEIDETVCFYSSADDYWKPVHNPDGFTDGG